MAHPPISCPYDRPQLQRRKGIFSCLDQGGPVPVLRPPPDVVLRSPRCHHHEAQAVLDAAALPHGGAGGVEEGGGEKRAMVFVDRFNYNFYWLS